MKVVKESRIHGGKGQSHLKIAVVVPCFRVTNSLSTVLTAIGPEVDTIYCVDDDCPDGSGKIAEEMAKKDSRVNVLYHDHNRGVGAAMVTGYKAAIDQKTDIIIKVDGDGQMDPSMIPRLIAPLLDNNADYVKGNRFYWLDSLRTMPMVRLIGNAGLSFLSKISSGYWNLFDPTNGFTAIHRTILEVLPLDKLHDRYFFESDMLFRLNVLQAVVVDVPMDSYYGDERSNLNIKKALLIFPWLHLRCFIKRLFYNYFLRNFSIASINLVLGVGMLVFGLGFGAIKWSESLITGLDATPGTVMLAGLPMIIGTQLILSFLAYDIEHVPSIPIHPRLPNYDGKG